MSGYKITKSVPLPALWQPGRGRRRKYPFAEMKPGDSFVGPLSAKFAAHQYAGYHGIAFTTTKISKGKVRIWRVDGLAGYDF